MEKEKKKSKSFSIFLIVLTIVTIGIIFFISKHSNGTGYTVADSISGAIKGSNCHDEQIAYEEQEEYLKTEYYTETVPYQEEVNLKYSDKQVPPETCSDFGNYKECYYVDISNLDTIGGTFTVNCNFRTIDRTLYDSQTLFVQSGEITRFKCVADVDLGEDVAPTYSVTPGTKTETKYKDVQRERQVTAYRPVTKYKTEQVCN